MSALRSPGGEWVAVVRAGRPFESRVESFLETALWGFFWFFPLRLCRIEVAVFEAAAVPAERAALRTLVSRLIWRGQGSPREARGVALSWVGPRTVLAVFRGTAFSVEVPPRAPRST